jgi:hypothetical protein
MLIDLSLPINAQDLALGIGTMTSISPPSEIFVWVRRRNCILASFT